MYPFLIAIFFGSIVAAVSAVQIPKEQDFALVARANVDATNLIAYRKSVQSYFVVNPAATGVISDAALTPYYLPGYIRNSNWTNITTGGNTYVYTTTTIASNVINIVYKKSNNSLLIGKKNSVSGNLQSFNGFDTGIVLPVSIPNNALVILGK